MSYIRNRFQGGIGALATEVEPIQTVVMAPSKDTTTALTKLMLAVPVPQYSKPALITPGVKVVQAYPTPPNVLVRVPKTATTPIQTLREALLFAGTPAAAPTGPNLQIGTGIGAPTPRADPPETVVDQVMQENKVYTAPPPPPPAPIYPVKVLVGPAPTPVQYTGSKGGTMPIPFTPDQFQVPIAPVPVQPAPSSRLPWLLIGGGVLAYLLLKD